MNWNDHVKIVELPHHYIDLFFLPIGYIWVFPCHDNLQTVCAISLYPHWKIIQNFNSMIKHMVGKMVRPCIYVCCYISKDVRHWHFVKISVHSSRMKEMKLVTEVSRFISFFHYFRNRIYKLMFNTRRGTAKVVIYINLNHIIPMILKGQCNLHFFHYNPKRL